MDAVISYTQFDVTNVDTEYGRLTKIGVEFSVKSSTMGTTKYAVFNDPVGMILNKWKNLKQYYLSL